MRFHCRATGNPTPKVEWYLNGQQIRKSKRFQLWNDGLHYLEINPARAYDTGSLVAVAVNKVGQAQASCTVDVEPLGDLRSNLKRVEGTSPDASLRAMRMDQKLKSEQDSAILGAYLQSKTAFKMSPDKSEESPVSYLQMTPDPFARPTSKSSWSEHFDVVSEECQSDICSPQLQQINNNKKIRKDTPFYENSAKSAFCGQKAKNVVTPKQYEATLRNAKDLLKKTSPTDNEKVKQAKTPVLRSSSNFESFQNNFEFPGFSMWNDTIKISFESL